MRPTAILATALAAALWAACPALPQDKQIDLDAATEAPAEADAPKDTPAEAPAEAPDDDAPKQAPKEPPVLSADAEALPEAKTTDKNQPLNLWADQIVYEGDTFTCTGNVLVLRGTSRIECDKLVGTIAPTEKLDKATGKKITQKAITNLTATGSPIKMDSGVRQARCLKAVYDLVQGTVTLTGSEEEPPMMTDNGRTARGKSITFFVNENPVKVVIEKGPIEIPIPSGMPDMLK